MTISLQFLRRASIVSLVLVLAVTASLALAQPVAADELVQSEPHASETINHAPETILLTFDEPLLLEPGANSAAIIDEQGVRVDDGRAEISGYSDRSLLVRPQYGSELEGAVSVAYVVTFASGESRSGSIEFTVDPQFEGAEESGVISTPATDQGIVLWTLAIMAAVALFVSLAYYLRFATDNAQSSLEEPGGDEHH